MHIQCIHTVLIAKGLHARSQGNRYIQVYGTYLSKVKRTGPATSDLVLRLAIWVHAWALITICIINLARNGGKKGILT